MSPLSAPSRWKDLASASSTKRPYCKIAPPVSVSSPFTLHDLQLKYRDVRNNTTSLQHSRVYPTSTSAVLSDIVLSQNDSMKAAGIIPVLILKKTVHSYEEATPNGGEPLQTITMQDSASCDTKADSLAYDA